MLATGSPCIEDSNFAQLQSQLGGNTSNMAASQPCIRSGSLYSSLMSGVRSAASPQAALLYTSPTSVRNMRTSMRRPSLHHGMHIVGYLLNNNKATMIPVAGKDAMP